MTKELYFVDTLRSAKYNKTLEALLFCIKYIALDESLMTNIVLGFASSLSTLVLNSRDWSEIVWLPEILRFKINLAISFI